VVNPNDQIRQRILQYFYDRNAASTSRYGQKGSAVKISDVKRELKERHHLKQNEVQANLTYLIDNGWVKPIDVQRKITTKGGTERTPTTTYYEITAKGIDKIEGGSTFQPTETFAGINITATGKNIITLGDGNVVNAEYSELREALDDLKEAIKTSGVEDAKKLNAVADIETMKSQLAKPEPNKTVLSTLWSGLKNLATVEGVAQAVERVQRLVAPLWP